MCVINGAYSLDRLRPKVTKLEDEWDSLESTYGPGSTCREELRRRANYDISFTNKQRCYESRYHEAQII